MNASIHRATQIAFFREPGFLKVTVFADGDTHEFNIHLATNGTPEMRETDNRCLVMETDFPAPQVG